MKSYLDQVLEAIQVNQSNPSALKFCIAHAIFEGSMDSSVVREAENYVNGVTAEATPLLRPQTS